MSRRQCRPLKVFQSTLPARGATPFREANELDVLTFQSTLPARGATNLKLGYGGTQKISIHAPRTGSNRTSSSIFPGRPHFNPRSPHGERRKVLANWDNDLIISIHAPRTGSNRTSSSIFPGRPHFNPRSPHGERRKVLANWDNDLIISIHAPRTGSDRNMAVRAYPEKIFQSTLPARGATRSATRSSSSLTFQSTLPARGATVCRAPNRAGTADFNPRSLHGERRNASPCV